MQLIKLLENSFKELKIRVNYLKEFLGKIIYLYMKKALIVFLFFVIYSCLKQKSIKGLEKPLSVLANKEFYFILNYGNNNSFVSVISRYKRKTENKIFLPFDDAQCFSVNKNKLFVASKNVLFSYDILQGKKLKEKVFTSLVFKSIFATKKALYAFVYDIGEQKDKFILIHSKNFLFKDLTPSGLESISSLTYDENFGVIYFFSKDFQVNLETKLFRYHRRVDIFTPIALKRKKNSYYVLDSRINSLFLSEKSLFYYINKKSFIVELDINNFRFKREFFLGDEGKERELGQFFFDRETKEFLIPDKESNQVLFYSY